MRKHVAWLALVLVGFALGAVPAAAGGLEATLYKDLLCGCCKKYVAYLGRAGFRVSVVDTSEMETVKEGYNIPDELHSCHTMLFAGYVVEGHVPLAALKKLFFERPDIAGIALPGMPQGSPGMGGPQTEPFAIYTIPRNGPPEPFMTI